MANGINTIYEKSQLDKLNDLIKDEIELRKEAENELLGIQISNAQKLLDKKKALLREEKRQELILAEQAATKAAAAAKKQAKKSGKALTKEEEEEIKKKVRETFKLTQKEEDKLKKEAEKKQKKEDGKKYKNAAQQALSDAGLTGFGAVFGGKKIQQALTDAGYTGDTKKAARALQADAVYNALAGFAKQLESTINDIAGMQSSIDTRLQGSSASKYMGSYWKQMNLDITRYVGMSGLVKQSDVANNLKTMVGKGIAYNVEERAFLQTIKDKIADTFDATQTSLVKLVRIQQQDTTAARLGMESALTSFLNNMYETTEYMSEMAESVKNNIYEASALMSAKSATEFEYQIQKWLGSLYSVGFGTDLSSAIGSLAAGDISSISNGGIGNLLVMAANKANMSVADILADGLDSSETNQLMQAMVEYLGEIYNQTKGSNVLAQQYASVFGLKASDLKAAANLIGSTSTIAGNNLSYSGMMTQLTNMANTMYQRTSSGEMMTNMFDNLKYATASSIAANPVTYAIYTLAGMLEDTVGGISIPSVMAMGSGFDLETTVADLMRVGTIGYGLLGGIGRMVSGIGQNGTAAGMLKGFGVGTANAVSRGTGSGLLTTSGATTSESGYTANSSGSDIQSKTVGDSEDEASQKVSAAEEENDEATTTDINNNVIAIYTLLDELTSGTRVMHVDIDNTFAWNTDGTGTFIG